MDFEWDIEKAGKNELKHQVSFYVACEVFDDELSLAVDDPDHSINEARYLIFGKSFAGKYIVVSYTERNDRIRIISARIMTPRERKAYEE